MRHIRNALSAVVAIGLFAGAAAAQEEVSRAVTDGGITVPGWTGRIDANETKAGLTLNNARFASHGAGMHVTTGPAVTYWNPSNRVSGDYTVKATFTEENYMSLNSHPHPYGIVIAGNRMGSEQQSFLYCAAYGNGRFIARGFGPAPFQLNGRGAEHPAVNKAAGTGQPVTQEVAVSVRGNTVNCAINGTVVATFPRSDIVADGRLSTTDGIYGLRFGHNTEVMVTGLTVSRGIPVTK